jgi:hypothetical protein
VIITARFADKKCGSTPKEKAMSKRTVLIFIFVLVNVLSGTAWYQCHAYREAARLKTFLGTNQNVQVAPPSPESFFDITDPNDKIGKKP